MKAAVRAEIKSSADRVVQHVDEPRYIFRAACMREGERISRLYPEYEDTVLGSMVWAKALAMSNK